MPFDPTRTALLLIDPYNDFLSEGGKIWPRIKAVAEDVDAIPNLRAVVAAARASAVRVVFVPHHRYDPGDYEDWAYATPYQLQGAQRQVFARGSWGGTFHDDFQPRDGELVASEHWGSSGFANTDLNQLLRQHGIDRVILVGMIANTCLEATGRFAMELGFEVTLVSDATAAFTPEAMHAAHAINGPTFAHAIVTTSALITQLRTQAQA